MFQLFYSFYVQPNQTKKNTSPLSIHLTWFPTLCKTTWPTCTTALEQVSKRRAETISLTRKWHRLAPLPIFKVTDDGVKDEHSKAPTVRAWNVRLLCAELGRVKTVTSLMMVFEIYYTYSVSLVCKDGGQYRWQRCLVSMDTGMWASFEREAFEWWISFIFEVVTFFFFTAGRVSLGYDVNWAWQKVQRKWNLFTSGRVINTLPNLAKFIPK